MPNFRRVLNRKVQVLIKISPPLILSRFQKIYRVTKEGGVFARKIYRGIREGEEILKICRGMKGGVHYPFQPPRGVKWENK